MPPFPMHSLVITISQKLPCLKIYFLDRNPDHKMKPFPKFYCVLRWVFIQQFSYRVNVFLQILN